MKYLNNRLLNCFLTLILTLSLSACVDLSAVKYHPSKNTLSYSQVLEKKVILKKSPYHGEVHTMLGGLGVFSTGMKELSASVEKTYHIPAPSGMWYNAGNVSRSVIAYYRSHKTHRPIILVGHSLGANEQIKVARNLDKVGIPVDLLVTVDAVSQTIIPPNVKHAMNFYKSGYVPMFSGLKIRAVNPAKTKIENINVTTLKNVQVNHFTIDKNPVVQAMIMKEIKRVTNNETRTKG